MPASGARARAVLVSTGMTAGIIAPIRHVLVCTDFGSAAEHALDIALPIARAFDAKLTLFHVWSVPTPIYAEALSWPTEELEDAARRSLEELRNAVVTKHPRTTAALDAGEPWQRILAYVKEHAVDLVVVGTQGRRGLPRLVLGSVAEKLVRLSPVPVLTTHGA
jgi:nucleotide-binding universal stress UspA family protein